MIEILPGISLVDAIVLGLYAFWLGITTLVVMANLVFAPRYRKLIRSGSEEPLVSVLIPARDEEDNIGTCLESVLDQTYSNYEIHVLDDESIDNTYRIVSDLCREHCRLRVHQGEPLEKGWLGKNWACHQLSQKAGGDILFFVDADCAMAEWALESAVARIERKGLALLSCFPRQVMKGFQQRLIVPLMNWFLLSLLPLRMVYQSSWLSFVAANGQFMAFTRKAYDAIGGHGAVRDRVVEDMELARAVKKNRLRMMTMLGGRGISCDMYGSFREALEGFSKNFYPGFNSAVPVFAAILFFIVMLFLAPFFLVMYHKYFLVFAGAVLLQRLLLSITVKENPLFNIFFHPVQMVIMAIIGINSVRTALAGKITWKGRSIEAA
jgi:chlorobactene glucosyltransferase